MNVQSKFQEIVMTRAILASCLFIQLSACTDPAPSSQPPTSTDPQDVELACSWLGGGSCPVSTSSPTSPSSPSLDWKSPYFWGDFFLAKYATQRKAALDHIEAGPPKLATPRTVLLVTGVTIPAEWFDPIIARLKRDGFVPVVYEPPALLSGDLQQATEELATVIDRVRRDSGQQKIDILAECTGGVIARHYLQSMGGDRNVSRLVTFVSPQSGIAVAPIIARVVGWPALYDLSPGSAFLAKVDGATPPASVKVTSIYTCTDEYIQPFVSSIIPGATNIGLCGHGFVGHFQTMYDPSIYLVMHDALVQ
jgi:triacylglycerol esterase/lipase EstA (alpha/beta hydrolase family)